MLRTLLGHNTACPTWKTLAADLSALRTRRRERGEFRSLRDDCRDVAPFWYSLPCRTCATVLWPSLWRGLLTWSPRRAASHTALTNHWFPVRVRRIVVLAVCVLALALTMVNAVAAAKKRIVTVTRSATSPVIGVSQWGQLQLTITVRVTRTTVGAKTTKSFKVTSIAWPIFPEHTNQSAYISSKALPLLRQEILQLKGNQIQLVSGATYTSYGFVQALRSALTKAGAL